MNSINGTELTLEKRLELLRNAKASSPEAAAAKLRTLGNYLTTRIVANTRDLDLLFDDCELNDYDGISDIDVEHYMGFVHLFKYALADARCSKEDSLVDSFKGVNFINVMVLWASMLLDKTKNMNKAKSNDVIIYNALNMSLGDFWDAIIGTCVTEDGVIDESRKNKMIYARDIYMMTRNPDVSLKEELASLLNLYQKGWFAFGKIDNILSTDAELWEYLERQEVLDELYNEICDAADYDYYEYSGDETENAEHGDEPAYVSDADTVAEPAEIDSRDGVTGARICYSSEEEQNYDSAIDRDYVQFCMDTNADIEEYMLKIDPIGYFMQQIRDFTCPVSNFADDEVRNIRDVILLRNKSYRQEDLKEMRESIKCVSFQQQFDEIANDSDLAKAKLICEHSAMLIYQLLVFPFLELKRYHYESIALEQ